MTLLTSGGDDPTGKKLRKMRPVKASASLRREYTAALKAQADLLRAASANLSELIKSGAARSQVTTRLVTLMESTQATIEKVAPTVAGSFVTQADAENKRATEENLRKAMGVNFLTILEEAPGVRDAVAKATTDNVALITSIPAEHWQKVAKAVLDNYAGSPDPTSLTSRIQQLGGVTKRRAGLIARDQTGKLSGALNSARQQSVGVESYIWRTAKDRRVVGDPNGLYPTPTARHHDHFEREGVEYRWDTPPPGGHPGEEIQCRCYAEPVLNPETLKVRHV